MPTTVNGHAVPVEYYVPSGSGPFPLIFLLHSSAGALTLVSKSEPSRENFGEKVLARHCFAVVLPHYLEAIGVKSMLSREDIASHYPLLLSISESLLTSAENLSYVHGQPVFLLGQSLGGYLSVSLGLRRSEIAAISEVSGGLVSDFAPSNPHVFGVLISHGTTDSSVPIRDAESLRRFCLANRLPVTMNLYNGIGHYLPHSVQSNIISTTVIYFRGVLNQLQAVQCPDRTACSNGFAH